MSPIKQETPKPGETPEEYFGRVIGMAREQETTIVISLGEKYVDVDPTTTLEYLLGYYKCLQESSN